MYSLSAKRIPIQGKREKDKTEKKFGKKVPKTGLDKYLGCILCSKIKIQQLQLKEYQEVSKSFDLVVALVEQVIKL